MRKIKSYLKSKTIQFALLGFIAGLVPIANNIKERRSFDIWEDGMQTVILALTTVGVVNSRIQANSLLYTPDGLPGPNKHDLVIDLNTEQSVDHDVKF